MPGDESSGLSDSPLPVPPADYQRAPRRPHPCPFVQPQRPCAAVEKHHLPHAVLTVQRAARLRAARHRLAPCNPSSSPLVPQLMPASEMQYCYDNDCPVLDELSMPPLAACVESMPPLAARVECNTPDLASRTSLSYAQHVSSPVLTTTPSVAFVAPMLGLVAARVKRLDMRLADDPDTRRLCPGSLFYGQQDGPNHFRQLLRVTDTRFFSSPAEAYAHYQARNMHHTLFPPGWCVFNDAPVATPTSAEQYYRQFFYRDTSAWNRPDARAVRVWCRVV